MGEFDLIARYFTRPTRRADLGVGDDCALLTIRAGHQLATSCDMLVEGRHFFKDVDPRTLGHKALAVNLSDLAACGAQPLAFTLALSLPHAEEAWLAAFADGLWALANDHGCELIGGDTTQGPLNICISVFGEVPVAEGRSQALLRSGAQVGDDLYVSGQLGEARLALEVLLGRLQLPDAVLRATRQRLEMPTPRVALGLALRHLASAAIDLSDGLAGDLTHLLQRSGVGATLHVDGPAQALAARYAHADLPLSAQDWRQLAISGGDDYELLFSAAPAHRAAIALAAQRSQTPVQRIGSIELQPGLRCVDANGQVLASHFTSFDHFA